MADGVDAKPPGTRLTLPRVAPAAAKPRAPRGGGGGGRNPDVQLVHGLDMWAPTGRYPRAAVEAAH